MGDGSWGSVGTADWGAQSTLVNFKEDDMEGEEDPNGEDWVATAEVLKEQEKGVMTNVFITGRYYL